MRHVIEDLVPLFSVSVRPTGADAEDFLDEDEADEAFGVAHRQGHGRPAGRVFFSCLPR